MKCGSCSDGKQYKWPVIWPKKTKTKTKKPKKKKVKCKQQHSEWDATLSAFENHIGNNWPRSVAGPRRGHTLGEPERKTQASGLCSAV